MLVFLACSFPDIFLLSVSLSARLCTSYGTCGLEPQIHPSWAKLKTLGIFACHCN